MKFTDYIFFKDTLKFHQYLWASFLWFKKQIMKCMTIVFNPLCHQKLNFAIIYLSGFEYRVFGQEKYKLIVKIFSLKCYIVKKTLLELGCKNL